ncbi:LTA synthase family protein [Daejeonella sp. JGW-45]|uniref:LTA synthase family protein n=1 Tax=Daejeonella sp. JGW-45 TaxID=3034148 RepID=UPI0023EC3BCF|nr:LTA synthase family protein [Daejeonella sp. JGW-45]
MLKSFVVFFRFYVFWILFFAIERLVFLLYFSDKLKAVSFGEKAASFWYALRLDSSMVAYISALPLIIYILFLFLKRSYLSRSVPRVFVIVLICAFSIITAFNFNLYREWGSKINYRALDMAFNSTNEAIASGSSSPILLSALILLGLIAVGIFLSEKLIDYRLQDTGASLLKKISGSFLVVAICALVIRGGWQLSPINQSMAYFSSETILNHAAVNTEWNLLQDVLSNKYGNDNPYKYYSPGEAKKIVDSLFEKPTDESTNILTTTKPNVVLIVIESFTAELIESLGGEKGVAPNMTQLSRDGLLFTDIYAAAGRTDKGMIATLSAFPGQAIRSIMKQNDKQEKLPGIARDFKSIGYNTSFYYGGESEFFNMKSYILGHGYDKLIDQHSFEKKDMNSKWGTYDHMVFRKNLNDLGKEGQPFFSTILTLTNHEPFELPGKPHFPGENVENKFRSTFFYTDSCLGAYIREARKTHWYKNTLFVILADHSHRLPGNLAEYDPKRYRIPLLFYGDVVKPEFRGQTVNKTGNQTDLAATLLTQLSIDPSRYQWSRDLLNPGNKGFAFFNWDNGFAFGTEEQIVSFDNVGKNIILRKKPADARTDKELTYYGKAYMQRVFQEYLEY